MLVTSESGRRSSRSVESMAALVAAAQRRVGLVRASGGGDGGRAREEVALALELRDGSRPAPCCSRNKPGAGFSRLRRLEEVECVGGCR